MDAETEFYKSIPVDIRGKLQEYIKKYSNNPKIPLTQRKHLLCFIWDDAPEGMVFWNKHYANNTFPIWSKEQQRFINP